ncbi:MAG: SDR family oxidoreductase [Gammaproteobacteria bacterium]|nr:SDR family oxidoreductase [Gammaproteobacteria bacterium]NNJ50667.1 SDR family oxidoreductase [Gammaproteobacteria bacterium]
MPDDFQITITGCGHIGKLLAQQLLKKEFRVTGHVSSDSSVAECSSRNIPCEIIDLDKPLADIDLSGHRVIYLAPPPRSGKSDSRMTNYLQAIASHPPEKFVLISTTGVYGDCQGAWIDESTPLKPVADRAFRRADAERQVQQYCQRLDIPLLILRVPGIYGPGKIPLARIKSGQPIVNAEDSPFTNRIHSADLVDVCERGLLHSEITGIYNVTDGNPGTMHEYFTGVAAAMNLPAPPAISLQEAQQQLSEGMLSYMAESRRINNKKLLEDFKIALKYPRLQDGLKHLS